MQVLHERFEPDPDVAVLAVNFDDGADPTAYLAEHDYTYPTIVKGAAIARRFNVTKLPTFVVVDREGRVVHTHVGRMTDEVRRSIERIAMDARED